MWKGPSCVFIIIFIYLCIYSFVFQTWTSVRLTTEAVSSSVSTMRDITGADASPAFTCPWMAARVSKRSARVRLGTNHRWSFSMCDDPCKHYKPELGRNRVDAGSIGPISDQFWYVYRDNLLTKPIVPTRPSRDWFFTWFATIYCSA